MILIGFLGAVAWTALMVLIEEVKPAKHITTPLCFRNHD